MLKDFCFWRVKYSFPFILLVWFDHLLLWFRQTWNNITYFWRKTIAAWSLSARFNQTSWWIIINWMSTFSLLFHLTIPSFLWDLSLLGWLNKPKLILVSIKNIIFVCSWSWIFIFFLKIWIFKCVYNFLCLLFETRYFWLVQNLCCL